MPTIKERIEADLVQAMKSGNVSVRDTLRMISAAIKNKEIEKQGELSDDDLVALLRREAKSRDEAAGEYRRVGSSERAAKELAEKKIIEGYLPAQMSDEELKQIVADAVKKTGASSMQDMGKVMKEAMPRVAGKADGGRVSEVVKQHFS